MVEALQKPSTSHGPFRAVTSSLRGSAPEWKVLSLWLGLSSFILTAGSIFISIQSMRKAILDPYNAGSHDLGVVERSLPHVGQDSRLARATSNVGDAPPVRLFSDRTLLTIAVDNYVSCPEKCIFAHVNLPPWVRYRYIDFQNENDLIQRTDINSSHLLLVARTNLIKLSEFAAQRRKDHPGWSVGLWHMADERIFRGEIEKPYPRFDYVLRHYYRSDFYGMNLRALGNITCGHSPPLPSTNPKEPKWGVHWLHLDSHSMSVHMQRSASSIWPVQRRPTNCSFIGRGDVKRSIGERKAMAEAVKQHSELQCKVETTKGFAGGDEAFAYYNYRLAESKIGLSPRGSAIETHRLAEILRMGAVPALKDEEYLHATFIDLPGIIAKNWTLVLEKMRYYLLKAPEELDQLAQKSAKFSEDLHQCVIGDIDYIFRKAFDVQSEMAVSNGTRRHEEVGEGTAPVLS